LVLSRVQENAFCIRTTLSDHQLSVCLHNFLVELHLRRSLTLPRPQLTPAYRAYLLERREVGDRQGELRPDPLTFIRKDKSPQAHTSLSQHRCPLVTLRLDGLFGIRRGSDGAVRSGGLGYHSFRAYSATIRLVLLGRNSIKERTTVFIFVSCSSRLKKV
jgi:hypothetical protein